MKFNRLSILGVGLLGGSIGLAVKSVSRSTHIIGYGHRADSLRRAQELGVINQAFDAVGDAVRDAELIILCTPITAFENIFKEIAETLPAGAIITDVASTKRSVVSLAQRTLPAHVRFVASHPMAGSEQRGIDSARADLLHGALCLTTPTAETDGSALESVEQFWIDLGMRIMRCSPEDHDRLVGSISHLPHAMAAALVNMQSEDALKLASKGFADATRIAAGDPVLWEAILLDNADNVGAGIDAIQEQLQKLKTMLNPACSDELRAWLQSAADKRRSL